MRHPTNPYSLEARAARTIQIAQHGDAVVKAIKSEYGDNQHWDFLLLQLADPVHIRPTKELNPGANRLERYNPKTNEWEAYVPGNPDHRGTPKSNQLYRFTKKTATTLWHQQIELYSVSAVPTVGVLFDLNYVHQKNEKYIFPGNVVTNDEWWIRNNKPEHLPHQSISLDQLKEINARLSTQQQTSAHNECLFGLSKESFSAIFATQDNLTARLNALHKRSLTEASQGIRLPILIITTGAVPREYTKAMQAEDIEAASQADASPFAHDFAQAHIAIQNGLHEHRSATGPIESAEENIKLSYAYDFCTDGDFDHETLSDLSQTLNIEVNDLHNAIFDTALEQKNYILIMQLLDMNKGLTDNLKNLYQNGLLNNAYPELLIQLVTLSAQMDKRDFIAELLKRLRLPETEQPILDKIFLNHLDKPSAVDYATSIIDRLSDFSDPIFDTLLSAALKTDPPKFDLADALLSEGKKISPKHYKELISKTFEKKWGFKHPIFGKILWHATKNSDQKIVKTLLAHGVDKTSKIKNLTAIEIATVNENWNLVVEFAKYPADANDAARYGTALLYATANGKYKLARELLHQGAQVTHAFTAGDYKGFTPLHFAVLNGQPRLLSALLKKGANPNYCYQDGKTVMELALEEKSPKRNALLHTLLKHGAEISEKSLVSLIENAGNDFQFNPMPLFVEKYIVLKNPDLSNDQVEKVMDFYFADPNDLEELKDRIDPIDGMPVLNALYHCVKQLGHTNSSTLLKTYRGFAFNAFLQHTKSLASQDQLRHLKWAKTQAIFSKHCSTYSFGKISTLVQINKEIKRVEGVLNESRSNSYSPGLFHSEGTTTSEESEKTTTRSSSFTGP